MASERASACHPLVNSQLRRAIICILNDVDAPSRVVSPPPRPPPSLHLLPSSCRASTLRRRRHRRRCIVAQVVLIYPNVERCYLRPPPSQPLSLANEPFAARFIMLAPCFSFLSFFTGFVYIHSSLCLCLLSLSFASFHFSRVCFWLSAL